MPLFGKNVLIAEDNLLIATDLRQVIEEAHGAVTLTGSAATADELSDDADLVLLDVELMDGNAYWVARRLRERHIPFIIVTGYDCEGLPLDLRTAPLVTKPYSGVQLLDAAVASCSNGRHWREWALHPC
jgi:DNA-binding response OmpR family regulator